MQGGGGQKRFGPCSFWMTPKVFIEICAAQTQDSLSHFRREDTLKFEETTLSRSNQKVLSIALDDFLLSRDTIES